MPCIVGLAAAAPVLAFTSVPPGDSEHDKILAEAGAPFGITSDALDALQQAVRRPDVAEMEVEPGDADKLGLIDAAPDYEASHHCDRVPPATAEASFLTAGQYIRLQRETAGQWLVAGHADRALRALGNALHALQDCFSHTNVGEMDGSAQERSLASLLSADAPRPPAGLLVCGFQPGLEDPELPVGDAYPHGAFNKDGPNSTADAQARLPDGRTKHDAARALAITATARFLEAFFANVTASQKASLLALDAEISVEKTDAPSGPLVAAAVALSAAGWLRGRGRR